ncbi:20409_t:CDS:1, partial [Gigaspora margarita]
PFYKKWTCCGKPELTVFISGSIKSIKHDKLEVWLRSITPLPCEHILKKDASAWGHVHFRTRYDASKFFSEMKDNPSTGPHKCEIIFSNATHFRTKKMVEYIDVRFFG